MLLINTVVSCSIILIMIRNPFSHREILDSNPQFVYYLFSYCLRMHRRNRSCNLHYIGIPQLMNLPAGITMVMLL